MAEVSSKSTKLSIKRKTIAEDPASVISLVSKVATKLQEHEAFGELGLTQWAALRAIASDPKTAGAAIARKLGYTRQRSGQIVQSLKEAGLITVAKSSGDNRKKDLAITPAGQKTLREVNARVDELLKKVFADKPKGAARLNGLMNKLLKAVSPPKAKPSTVSEAAN